MPYSANSYKYFTAGGNVSSIYELHEGSWEQSSSITSERDSNKGTYIPTGTFGNIPSIATITSAALKFQCKQSRSNTTLYHSKFGAKIYVDGVLKDTKKTGDIGDSYTQVDFPFSISTDVFNRNGIAVEIHAYYKGALKTTQYMKMLQVAISYSMPDRRVTLSAGTGGRAYVWGIRMPLNCTMSDEENMYPYASTISFRAEVTDDSYTFVGWSDGDTNPEREITIFEKDISLSAIFAPIKTLNITEAFMLKDDNHTVSSSFPVITGQGYILKVKAVME